MGVYIKNNRIKWFQYLLLTTLIAITGFDYFFLRKGYLVSLFIISGGYFIYKRFRFDKFIVIFIAIVILSQFLQFLIFNYYVLTVGISIFMRILVAYFIVKILGKRFIDYYIQIIYVFSIISLFFYTFYIIDSSLVSILVNNIPESLSIYGHNVNIIIHNFWMYNSVPPRNSGPFWEPGLFQAFINIALFWNLLKVKTLMTKKNIIFSLALFSTMSTTGYLIYFMIISVYFALIIRKRFLGWALFPLFLVVIVFVSKDISFLSQKIEHQLANSNIRNTRKNVMRHGNRFGVALRDLGNFIEYPIVGRGRFARTKFSQPIDINNSNTFHQSNGLTNLLVTYGLILFILYFTLLHMSFKSAIEYYGGNRTAAIFFLLLIMASSFSELILEKSFFIALTMLVVSYGKNNMPYNSIRKD